MTKQHRDHDEHHHDHGNHHHDHDHSHHHDHEGHHHDGHVHHHHHHHHGHDHDHEHGDHHHHDHGDEYGHEYDVYPRQFVTLYTSPSFDGIVIDVREEWEYEQIHLKDSISIPLRLLPERIKGLDPTRQYYMLCSQGIRSSFGVEYLLECGFERVHNIQSGVYGIVELFNNKVDDVDWIIINE